jgi:hypothetical protein
MTLSSCSPSWIGGTGLAALLSSTSSGGSLDDRTVHPQVSRRDIRAMALKIAMRQLSRRLSA